VPITRSCGRIEPGQPPEALVDRILGDVPTRIIDESDRPVLVVRYTD